MTARAIEVLTLSAYNVSSKGKRTFVGELFFFVGLLWILNGTTLLSDAPLIEKVFTLAAVYIGARVFFGAVRMPILSTYRSRMRLAIEDQDNFIIGVHSLSGVLSIVVLVVAIFVIFGIEFRPFLTSISVFAFAIVFIGIEYIKNFIDSFVLMFTRDFKIGEYIRIEPDIKGVIADITFRATKIKTDEGDILFVPNSKILHSEVVNYSKVRYKRVTVPFGLMRNQLQHLATFEEEIKSELCKSFPDLLKPEKVYVRVRDITATEVHLALEASVATYNFEIEERLRKWVSGYVLAQDQKI